ncbi:MAG: MFS transporter [Prevotella sp.]|nr:MFS transporter [Bacteroidales bacterium]MBO4821784.1 MFS transporter [Prevotella sp.]
MMMGYVFWDIVSPLSTTLKAPVSEGGMGWTSEEYGFYAGSYSIFNIFLLMLFWGGLILDKCGIRFTGLLATGMMLVGSVVNYFAVQYLSPTDYTDLPITLFGLIPAHMKVQVLVSALGFGMFGVGCDITGITVSKVVTKWFTGHELASAMGVQVAMARLGTASAISMSPVIANAYGVSAPLLAGAALLLMGFVMFIVYLIMDSRETSRTRDSRDISAPSKSDESFTFKDLLRILRNPGFWLIAILCVLFYSSLRPFLKFASDLLVNKYGIDTVTAGWIVSILPYGTIVLTPLFGLTYDRWGRGSLLMLIGCGIVTLCHLLLALPILQSTWFASLMMLLYGVSYSLVPSAMWPSVPKIVPLKQLGTAYSIIYFVQNIGLMLVPMLVGNVIGSHTDSTGHADFTIPMLVFAGFGIASTFFAFLLMQVDKKKGYGLSEANVKGEKTNESDTSD